MSEVVLLSSGGLTQQRWRIGYARGERQLSQFFLITDSIASKKSGQRYKRFYRRMEWLSPPEWISQQFFAVRDLG